MKGKSMQAKSRNTRCKQSGFTMIEMLIATVMIVVGLVAVAQLVPLAVHLNAGNRNDSTALVFAQRELDEMVDQPLSATTFSDPQGVLCPPAALCNLGNAANPRVPVGSPMVMLNNRPMIDFTQAAVANYSFNYTDPNDPFGLSYDVRWAVIAYANGGNATGKRFIVGVRRRGGNVPFLPVTLDTMVEK
jgi:prepilin-type N-terminal cleavage/methylation domain-containing protein